MIDIRGKSALVTGANRGLRHAFAEALLEAGAGRIYAGARDPSTVKDPRFTPVRLDVTKAEDVAAAAAGCGDVQIIINNAGAMLATPVLAESSEDALRREMEVNVFGMLAMARAFAPVLDSHGGGVIVNMLSVVSWYVYPFNGTYCVTKHAALALTDGLRIQLRRQGIRVMGVYAGFIDTDMGAALSSGPKTPPSQVARKTVEGILSGLTMSRPTNGRRVYGRPADKIRRGCRPRCRPAGTRNMPNIGADRLSPLSPRMRRNALFPFRFSCSRIRAPRAATQPPSRLEPW